MPDRYRETDIKSYAADNNDNRRVYQTTLFPQIQQDDSDVFITSKTGDRLDLLAYQFYKDVTLWWIIAQANAIGKGTMNIEPGQQLRIPKNIPTIMADLETINTEG